MTLEQFYKKRDDTLNEDVTLQQVVDKMYSLHLRYIVFIDSQNYPIGILTERDILFLYEQSIDFKTTNAYKYATKYLIKAHKERKLEYALNFMVDHNIRRVIIVDNSKRYLGTVEQEEIVFAFESCENKNNLKIYEVLMNESKALSVQIDETLENAIWIMKEHKIGSILVNDGLKSVGILTESDILILAKDKINKKEKVSKFMHSPIYKISIKDSLTDCVNLMKEKNIRRVVVEEVIEESGKIVDYIITTKDILNNLQGNYSKFLEKKLLSQKNIFNSLEDLVIEAYDFRNTQVISWVNKSAKEKLDIGIDDTLENIMSYSILKEILKALDKQEIFIKENVEIAGRFYRCTVSSDFMYDSRIIRILLSDFTELYLSNQQLADQVDFMSDSILEQESMQKEIINQNAIGIGYISTEGEILFVNKYTHDLLGYEEGELIGKNIEEITYKEDIEKSLSYRKELIKAGVKKSKTNIEKRYIHKDGSLIWVNLSLFYSMNKDRKVKYIIGFIKDIRERKAIEQQLILAKSVFDNSKEGIVIVDRKMHVRDINKGFTEILGYSKDEVLNKNIELFISINYGREFYKAMLVEVNQKGFWQGEVFGKRKNQEIFPKWLNINTIKDEAGKIIYYVGIFSDISMIKKSEEKLEFLAHHDHLTKLPNRLLISENLKQAIKRANRKKSKVAIIFLDLDNFKTINDTFGHSYGDEVLLNISARLKEVLREQDSVGRLGGDEFIILIEDFQEISNLEPVLEKIISVFKKPILINNNSFKISGSLGISVFPDDGRNIESLIKHADAAMYSAKDAGRDTYKFYAPDMTHELFTKMLMKTELQRAIENEEFILHYQPQVSLIDGKIIGLEALVRWQHPKMGLLYPDKFIQIAENTRQIISIGKIVLKMVCKDLNKLLSLGLFDARISVNISAVQIKEENFYDDIIQILSENNINGNNIELELTESHMMQNPERSIELFTKFKKHDLTLAIDDFGTGYSSLSYLKRLPVDRLKIDREFIKDIPSDHDDMAITSTIIAMSKSLGLGVIAEGIENEEQHDFLKQRGCYEGQGYMYSRPISFDKIVEYLKKFNL
ncbi:EAL domain-containing protein [Sulfurospirillum sp. 1307]